MARTTRSVAAVGVVIALALVAATLVISTARTNSLLGEEVLLVPVTPQLAYASGEDNIWNDGVSKDWAIDVKMKATNLTNTIQEMGTDSIFMHKMSSKDVEQARQARAQQPNPYMPAKGMNADDAWRHSSPFTGTNSVFFGSNGGGNGWASKPQSLYGEAAGGWSTKGHEAKPQSSIPSIPQLGGTNFAFNGADGYHYGWAREPRTAGAGAKEAKQHGAAAAPHAKSAKAAESAHRSIRATAQAAGGWSSRGHEAKPQTYIPSIPRLGGTNFAFNGADGYHYGWARRQAPGRVNKDVGVKAVHVAHPNLGFNF